MVKLIAIISWTTACFFTWAIALVDLATFAVTGSKYTSIAYNSDQGFVILLGYPGLFAVVSYLIMFTISFLLDICNN